VDRPQAGALGGSLDVPVNRLWRPREADLAGHSGKAVRSRYHALRRDPCVAVKAGEALAERAVEIEARRVEQDVAGGAREILRDERAFDLWAARNHADVCE